MTIYLVLWLIGKFLEFQIWNGSSQMKAFIGYAYGVGYYIHDGNLEKMKAKYLHKDGKWYNYCGNENFFLSREEAQKIIDRLNPRLEWE
jgi:hypothetical protein